MRQTKPKTEAVQVEETTIKLRIATAEDLKINSSTLRHGQPIWIKSMLSGKFDNGPLIISDSTNTQELAEWLKFKMIYVPISSLDV